MNLTMTDDEASVVREALVHYGKVAAEHAANLTMRGLGNHADRWLADGETCLTLVQRMEAPAT